MKKSILLKLHSHLTVNKFLVDFVVMSRSKVKTLQGLVRLKTLKFIALRLVSSVFLRLLKKRKLHKATPDRDTTHLSGISTLYKV